MRTSLGAFVIVALFVPAISAETDRAADERAIRAVWDQIVATFNNHDAKGWAALFDEAYENWTGDRKGPAAEEKSVAQYFSRNQGVRYKELRPMGLAFLAPDVAIYRTRGHISGEADGSSYELLEAWVFIKKKEWRVSTYFLKPIPK